MIANGNTALIAQIGQWGCERFFNALQERIEEIQRQLKKRPK